MHEGREMHHFGNLQRLDAHIMCRNTDEETDRNFPHPHSKITKNPGFKGLNNENQPFHSNWHATCKG